MLNHTWVFSEVRLRLLTTPEANKSEKMPKKIGIFFKSSIFCPGRGGKLGPKCLMVLVVHGRTC